MSITERPSLSASSGGNGGHDTNALLELSDLLDASLCLRLAAYREGYERGREAGYQVGYADGALDRKHAQQDLLKALQVHARRWELRGEPRARETFSQPHRDDFTGRGAA